MLLQRQGFLQVGKAECAMFATRLPGVLATRGCPPNGSMGLHTPRPLASALPTVCRVTQRWLDWRPALPHNLAYPASGRLADSLSAVWLPGPCWSVPDRQCPACTDTASLSAAQLVTFLASRACPLLGVGFTPGGCVCRHRFVPLPLPATTAHVARRALSRHHMA